MNILEGAHPRTLHRIGQGDRLARRPVTMGILNCVANPTQFRITIYG